MHWNAREKTIPLLLVIIQLLACLTGGFPPGVAENARADSPDAPPSLETGHYFDSQGGVLRGFSSHLPLIIIDTGDLTPDAFEQSGVEGGVTVSVYDQERNDPFTPPDFRTAAALESISLLVSSDRPKPDYALRLETGHALLGMDGQREWLLLGALSDKSLLRNYLAYTLAAQAGMPAPQARLCEVIVAWQGTLTYAGVYTLAQDTGQWAAQGAGGAVTAKRLPFLAEENLLPTRAAQTQYPAGSLVTLGGELPPQRIQEITARIDQIDAALYSTDHLRYLTYEQYLDEDSFVDYFVLNEFLCNYDAAYQSLYTYPADGGLLRAGPLGSFETAMDNSAFQAADPWRIQLDGAPWYERLAYSARFWERCTGGTRPCGRTCCPTGT